LALPDEIGVTVICACRNERAHIGALLASLEHLDRTRLDLDVVIADGASNDGTRDLLLAYAREHAWLRVIDNPERIAATGLNRAIQLSRSEYIVRVDAHTAYEPDYVFRSIQALRAHSAANAGGPQRSRATRYWQRAIGAGFHSEFAAGGARFRDDHYCGNVDTVPYGCWRRDFLLSLGLFDETLVRNQDDELNMRIRAVGGTIWQDPGIISWYSPRTSIAALFRQYFQFGFWRVAVMRKHPGSASLRQFVPGAAALVVCLLALLRFDRTLVALFLAYALLSFQASVRAARREGWDLLPALPLTFATYQAAYAAGFLAGLLYWFSPRGRNRQNPQRVRGARAVDS